MKDELGKTPTAKIDADGLVDRIAAHVDVKVQALLGETKVTIGELQSLAKGDVVELDTSLDGEVELRVRGTVIGAGELVSVDDRFGIRITRLG